MGLFENPYPPDRRPLGDRLEEAIDRSEVHSARLKMAMQCLNDNPGLEELLEFLRG